MLAVQQPQPQVEVLSPAQGAEEVQLVQELHALVQQVPLQKAEDRGTMWGAYGDRGVGAEGEHTHIMICDSLHH